MTKIYPRVITAQILSNLESPDILILLGARQVGKTSIIRLVENHLSKTTISKKFFFDAEDQLVRQKLNELNLLSLPAWLQSLGISSEEKIYLFIDEIQYLEHPASLLKIIHDHYPQIKLIVSGSSTLEIKNKLQDSLMGRKTVFHIDTLTFAEYLSFRNIPFPELLNFSLPQIMEKWETHHPIIIASHDSLFSYWQNFVISGGFPRVALSQNWDEAAKYLSEIKSTFINKDIAEFYRFLDGRAFSSLVTLLAEKTGNLTNEAELANTLGISKTTIARYIWLLEQTFAVFRLSPFFSNKRSELSKMPKIYFHDTGWRNIWIQPSLIPLSERTDAGYLAENSAVMGIHKKIILNQLDTSYTLHFWRTNVGQEVDIILSPVNRQQSTLPIEAKYQSMNKPIIPSGIKSFLHKYPKTTKAVVVTKDLTAKQKFGNKEIFYLPAWLLS